MEQRKYGLLTAITMIVGIVIGSGIFFKSYNVLVATGGSITEGVKAFLVAAVSIVFGCLAISELASRTDEAGGVISYSEDFWNKKVSIAFGWFHNFIYYPSLVAVVSWVAGIYGNVLFGWENNLETQTLFGLVVIFFLYGINIFNAKWGGKFQDATTIIKLLPLVLFGIVGLIFGDPSSAWTVTSDVAANGGNWLTALPAVLFAFDGWIIATTICHEIKDSKRNLYLALTISPIIILVLYVLYFVGISTYVGVDQVLALGSDHLQFAGEKLLNSAIGAKVIMTFVVVSIMGVVNGLILGYIRLPYSLSLRQMFPNSDKYTTVNSKHGVPLRSGVISLVISLVWMAGHYLTQKTGLLGNSDVSEISIIVNYLLYIVLYAAVIKLAVKGEIKNPIRGYVIPILAAVGSLVCVWSGFANKLFVYFIVFCAAVILAALAFEKSHHEAIESAVVPEGEN